VNTLEIVVLAIVLLLALLALGGAIAQRRRLAATEAQFRAMLEQANHDLAAAHAADNGWEPGGLEAAARQAFAEIAPGEEITQISLIQVVDKPGIEEDEAVFHIETREGSHRITLRRRGDDWVRR
jgi:type II secretory pathway pseudopilin PulG